MPNQPKTRAHALRVPDDLWAMALTKARTEQTTLTAIIVAALREYVEDR